jgi:hypothetical protein
MTRPGKYSPGYLHLTRAQWAKRMDQAWTEVASGAIAACIQIGRELIAAKRELAHGEFQKMVERDLPFGPRTARRLMAIARDDRLTNPNIMPALPPSWRTLYELTRLDIDHFDDLLSRGVIHPVMQRKEIGGP